MRPCVAQQRKFTRPSTSFQKQHTLCNATSKILNLPTTNPNLGIPGTQRILTATTWDQKGTEHRFEIGLAQARTCQTYTGNIFFVFPECVARVPVSFWGFRGLRLCSPDVTQPSATVGSGRVRTKWREFCKSGHLWTFGGCKCRVASFRVAGEAHCDIPTCFITCPKSFCVADAILLCCFEKMSCIFRGRRSTWATSIVILRGRRSTLDVLRCVFFCESHCHGCVQIPW